MFSKSKTLTSVLIAGLFFIPAVIYDIRYLFIVGAFFDWLPVFTKWMKFGNFPINKLGLLSHIILISVSYIFGIIWLFTGNSAFSFVFLEIWFSAVISGEFIYKRI